MHTSKKGYVLSDTANIFYQIFGNEKTAVILLHGNGEDWSVFKKQIKPLSKHFKLITIDSRGHGSSSKGMKALTIDIMADDVIAVMDSLDIKLAHIVGFSDGGNVALEIALNYPNRINKLIIAGANLNPAGLQLSVQIKDLMFFLLLKFLSIFSKKAKHKSEVVDLMVNQPNFTTDEISTLNIPTLVLAGEFDMIKREHTELIADSIPNAQLNILPGTNHFIFENDPAKATLIILTFLMDGNE